MTIKLYIKYRLRNGKMAIVDHDVSRYERIYKLRGVVYNEDGSVDRIAFWTESGRYNLDIMTSGYDIINAIR